MDRSRVGEASSTRAMPLQKLPVLSRSMQRGAMTVGSNLPYFDFLLDLLASKDQSVEQAFGRHVHWGYWPDPTSATGQGEDYAAAAERLALVLLEAAGIRSQERILD